ncbi:MAG TPA: PqqD family protein [Methylomirabilota bacterium]
MVARRLGESSVLVDLRTNRIYELNTTAARIWELAEAGRSIDQIVLALEDEYDSGGVDIRSEVDALVERLQAEGLLGADS